jgi:5-deoxy-glucuronate isomerase
MIVTQKEPYPFGYTAITEQDGKNAEMLLDFGILRLAEGQVWVSEKAKERALLLIKGEVVFHWENQEATGRRFSCLDENPIVLHVPEGLPVKITAIEESELAVEMVKNHNEFEPKFYGSDDISCGFLGKGALDEASVRTLRTVFDGESAPKSNMVLGEVVNYPGKWSSYPPHGHPQPEIYHYRLFPEQGFGISAIGEEPQIVKNRYTSLIRPDISHSQVAAPGYAMYYIWMIPHLPDDRWLPTTRYFVKGHEWLLEKDVAIWPERKFK